MRAVLERRHDAEVARTPAQRPEQVGIGILAGGDDLARREHHLGGQQVVDGHPVLPHQPRDTPAEREAGDPCARDDAAWNGEPEGGGGAVELADGDARLRSYRGSQRIDVDALHEREVDHQPALGDRPAGDVVATAADRDLDPFAPAESDRTQDVRGVQTSRDHRGMLVDQSVVDAPDLVVTGVTRDEDLPRQRIREQLDAVRRRRAGHQ